MGEYRAGWSFVVDERRAGPEQAHAISTTAAGSPTDRVAVVLSATSRSAACGSPVSQFQCSAPAPCQPFGLNSPRQFLEQSDSHARVASLQEVLVQPGF